MSRLKNSTQNTILAEHVETAKSFFARLKGLLGTNQLATNSTLWILQCRSIHTFFMRYAIDVVFVDKNLIVQKCSKNLKPWNLTWPSFTAESVFELPAGTIEKTKTNVGDKLCVVD